MTEKCCGTCRHSSVSCEERDCAKRPGWGAWEGGLCEDWVESNYQRYFGTPERAAAYLASHTRCTDCELLGEGCSSSRACKGAILAWLEADAL